ncbi:hypothetical protein ANN_04361 [Periplaneta americana]|uniref:Uncharacterized protein n=1 Tax=Periplaneta americana TaxID=6978 RepID=A0ABQ8T8C4_PERAM|nr:hypothetical protein ANN_04361 [Periplaneta americana]
MIPSCDGQTMSEYPLAGRLEDREVAGDSTTDKCAQCTRRQGEWCRQPFTQERRPARGFIKDRVYVPLLQADLPDLRQKIEAVVATITPDTLIKVWEELA